MCVEKWKGIFWWNFFLQLLGRRYCHKPKRNLFFELFGCLICEKISSLKTEGQSWSRAWKLSWSRFSTETQWNALNFWECMLDRLARDSIGLNPLGRRIKLTQYSILYCFLVVHVSSKSVKISAKQMFMKVSLVFKEKQFPSCVSKNRTRIVKYTVHHPYHTRPLRIHCWE